MLVDIYYILLFLIKQLIILYTVAHVFGRLSMVSIYLF